MREVVIATRNKKKLLELKRLLADIDVRILRLDAFDGLTEAKEDGKTFRANARKKALTISSRINKLVVADDSGLQVRQLNNAPGVKSARYAGASQDDVKNINKLLRKMKDVPTDKRKACFRCVICISKGKRLIKIVEGKVNGLIADKPRGCHGFGYDPVFIPDGFNKTFAQLGPGIKDRISHRAIALKKAKEVIRGHFQRYP